ncbi:HECT-type E3 ubiquitin transferase [Hyphodiscus hymeniophilus]|uniref:HECT-type E3 ubiquitin transferase n=1 Tax=Hyphodiscus hymeniophilus TaxID=353542 RepID=A0A9P6VJQ9_9HELO|nr:HECT-type E3 ubiquitin transferase [Hyphodiscus hymeniophilus]
MFQTFSGNSRRPRQVNLSGQNVNPFAASTWTPTASGTQQTVANAQQERLRRQQDRDKLNATKRLQRTWRGHKVRSDLADSRRDAWDRTQAGGSGSEATLAEQLRILVAFFSARRPADLKRLEDLSQTIGPMRWESFLRRQDIQPRIPRLAQITLEALQVSLPECQDTLLQFLTATTDCHPEVFPRISRPYYTYLSQLLVKNRSEKLDEGLILKAIRVPLVEHIDVAHNVLNAHAALASEFLTTPNLSSLVGGLHRIAPLVNVGRLSTALIREYSSAGKIQPSGQLWLLAHFIALHRLQRRSSQEPHFLRALSLQLSGCAGEIVGRIDNTDPEVADELSQAHNIPPLPSPIRDELLSLVNKASITGLLAKFNIDYAKASAAGEEDASLLASYALTLLRIFPRRGDDIRMWLYHGSMITSSGLEVPALKFFWQAMNLTNTFSAIRSDSKAALSILRPQTRRANSGSISMSDHARDREWRTILLFLELYTFVLRFTDDEEFLSASNVNFESSPVSRIRESALPIEDVKRLTLFLKNLAFTTYYNAGELSGDDNQVNEGGLGTYFGTNTNSSRFQPHDVTAIREDNTPRPFAGIAGMTFDYVRTIVRGVMRMLYERDSRRRFLSKDHWLMTSRFDMEGFIPAVVMEEERQHEAREGGEDAEVEDADLEMRDDLTLVGMARPRRAQQLESLQRQQQRVARKKVLAAVGPRLEVLQNMPFAIPFETRVQIFRQFVLLDQTRRRGGNVDPDIWRMSMMQNAFMQAGSDHRMGREALGRHHAKIRRDQVFGDAYEQFYDLGEGLKEPIQITFVDKFDTVEAGIDGGGVTKEFLTSVTNEAFRSEDGPNLFVTNDQNLLYPNPAALDERKGLMRQAGLTEQDVEWRENITDILRQYEFLGRIVGKCLYEGILVDIGFAAFFLLKWAASGSGGGYRANINDLRDLDETLYQGLLKLKNYPGNVEDFSLDFTIEDTISSPGAPTQTITRELMPNGSNIPVTNENRPLYVSYVARHRLQLQPYQQTQAFLRGLGEIIKPSWLSMFNQSELQTLIGGDSSEINVEDLRANTAYGGIYVIGDDGLEHPTIELFWKVMKELDDSDRRKVLKYVTSTPRAPLLGFSQLNPRFSIRDAGSDEERLPSTSTCVNLLKLPKYTTAGTLRSKLVYAVNSGAGFDLS